MTQKYEGILILSNLMDKTGSLNRESRLRADLGSKLFKSNVGSIIITSGFAYREDSSLEIGNAVKSYLVSQHKIPNNSIITELNSRDTVGDAYFTRINVIKEQNIKSLLIVTSDYHMPRTREIFNLIYGHSCQLDFKAVQTYYARSKITKEKKSLSEFRKTFGGITPGDIKKISGRLFKYHPLYLKFPN